MSSYNRAVLVGRICSDPEMKYTPAGKAVCNFRLAVDRPFKNAQGEKETDFITIVAWNKDAEFVNNFLEKGRLVLTEGRLQIRQWTNKEGARQYTTEIIADAVRALDRPKNLDAAESGEPITHPTRGAANDIEPGDIPDITDPFADQ